MSEIFGKEDHSIHYNQDQYSRSFKLLEIIKKYALPTDSILEIGASFGRNLEVLYDSGFKNVTALEPDEDVIKFINRPEIKRIVGTMQEKMKEMPKFDIIFTKSVLYLTSEPNYSEIADKVNKYLIISEGETNQRRKKKESFLHDRNYKDIFEKYGLKQIEEQEGLFTNHKIRIFKK